MGLQKLKLIPNSPECIAITTLKVWLMLERHRWSPGMVLLSIRQLYAKSNLWAFSYREIINQRVLHISFLTNSKIRTWEQEFKYWSKFVKMVSWSGKIKKKNQTHTHFLVTYKYNPQVIWKHVYNIENSYLRKVRDLVWNKNTGLKN